MIRSLRLRFFLITWPLIVVTVASVAFVFARWTDVRLTSTQEFGADPARQALRRHADSVLAPWAAGAVSDSALRLRINGLDGPDSISMIVIDARGRVVASNDEGIQLRRALDTLRDAGVREFTRSRQRAGLIAQELVAVSGQPIVDRSGVFRGALYLFTTTDAPPPMAAAALRADARRTLWIAVIIASAVAALLSVALAQPLIGQVARLAAAASRVRAGDLGVRVGVGSPDEIGRLEHTFNDMASTLERAETHKRNLVHDVAHELRTPLTNVVGILEAIEDGLRDADEGTLATLRREAALLAALVSDLQDLSLAESGQLAFELSSVDVVAESVAAVEAMKETADEVRITAPTGPPVFATADAQRVGQVLRNLLRNAITHTPAGGSVMVRVETRGDEIGVIVTDTGRGIPAAHLELIWERFHRVDPARDRAGGGRGLGLAIVKQFVAGMGGRVHASSVEGRGSTFEVWLK